MTPRLTFVLNTTVKNSGIWRADCGIYHFVIGFAREAGVYEVIYWVKNYIPHRIDTGPFDTLEEAQAAAEERLQTLVDIGSGMG